MLFDLPCFLSSSHLMTYVCCSFVSLFVLIYSVKVLISNLYVPAFFYLANSSTWMLQNIVNDIIWRCISLMNATSCSSVFRHPCFLLRSHSKFAAHSSCHVISPLAFRRFTSPHNACRCGLAFCPLIPFSISSGYFRRAYLCTLNLSKLCCVCLSEFCFYKTLLTSMRCDNLLKRLYLGYILLAVSIKIYW